MSYLKVKTDITKNYFNAAEALKDQGFTKVGRIHFQSLNDTESRDCFEKDGEQYYFVSMNHFNSTVYHVKLRNVSALKSEYDIVSIY